MAEPTSTTATTVGLYSLFITLFGVAAGEYALIIFASLAGGIWAVGSIKTIDRKAAGRLLLKIVAMAIVLTGCAANFVEWKWGWPMKQALAPVAFIIGFLGNRWHPLVNRVIEKVLPTSDKS